MPVERDNSFMRRALELAQRGRGFVEPNPMVGCVIVREDTVVGEGWHQRFGGPHAEVEALAAAAEQANGATLYVTLEPCCHHGKTPPCTEAVIAAGIRRVVAAMRDPFPKVAGGGFEQLQAAGVEVEVGLCETEARALNAPYLKLLGTGRPWVIAKWAMTLDGKIASASGDSRWISSEASRAIVHKLRSRVDGIVIGRRTAEHDDPLLTARSKSGSPPRVALRIVLDSGAKLAATSQLVQTAREFPTLIACGPEALDHDARRFVNAGCEVMRLPGATHGERLSELLDELGRRQMTNILVEGGSEVLGSFFDGREIDESHVFIAPKLLGGKSAPSPIGGAGISGMADAIATDDVTVETIGGDVYVHGRLSRPECTG
jgi:diaminohydroxyphosphoribosylaminopyrimidine deaminase/5-amino-6-(5-phosphoribosylamino)uracil reductase